MNNLGKIILLLAGLAPLTSAQDAPEPRQIGNYKVDQSVDLGWRFVGKSGNEDVYSTFVNLQQGPRILSQSFEAHSINHHGEFFDDLMLESFGEGGDPNTVIRLRAQKNKWYDFRLNFRRDLNFWDYDLSANPLNSPTSSPNVPVNFSPHRFATSRRMADYSLTLRPQSRFRFRLGYTHDAIAGPSFSSINEGGFQGAPTVLFQPVRESGDIYQMGFDARTLPRTNFSFDEFSESEKGDTSWSDQNFGYQLPGGTPVDLGVVFNTPFLPCFRPVINSGTTPPTANSFCNGFLSYMRSARERSADLTSRAAFQSQYLRQLELSGFFSYSSSHSDVPAFAELFDGLILPLNLREDTIHAGARAHIVNVSAELAETWALTPKLRLSDTFSWQNFRIPGVLSAQEATLFAASLLSVPSSFNPALCAGSSAVPTCPQHNLNSPPDFVLTTAGGFLGRDEKENRVLLEYDLTRHAGANIGYDYDERQIDHNNFQQDFETFFPDFANRGDCSNVPAAASGICDVLVSTSLLDNVHIHRHSALAGGRARLLRDNALRIDFSVEVTQADRSFTRIDPRTFKRYRMHARYAPFPWLSFAAASNISQAANDQTNVDEHERLRSADFNLHIGKSKQWATDFDYGWSTVSSHILICYISSLLPLNPPVCPTDAGLFVQTSFYDSTTNFGQAALLWKPSKRATVNAGYSITHLDGDSLLLDPLAAPGSLRSVYHRPIAQVVLDIRDGFSWVGSWNYYDYREPAPAGPTLPRDFHANLGTVALRYRF